MSSFEQARAHVAACRSDIDDPNLSMGEGELRDLALLRDAVDEAIAIHVRELVRFEGMSWTTAASALAASPTVLRYRYGRFSKE